MFVPAVNKAAKAAIFSESQTLIFRFARKTSAWVELTDPMAMPGCLLVYWVLLQAPTQPITHKMLGNLQVPGVGARLQFT